MVRLTLILSGLSILWNSYIFIIGDNFVYMFDTPTCDHQISPKGFWWFVYKPMWILNLLVFLCIQVIFILQNMEWWAMIYIIRTQHNRRVEEITFDHNHESFIRDINTYDLKYGLTYRRDELMRRKKY